MLSPRDRAEAQEMGVRLLCRGRNANPAVTLAVAQRQRISARPSHGGIFHFESCAQERVRSTRTPTERENARPLDPVTRSRRQGTFNHRFSSRPARRPRVLNLCCCKHSLRILPLCLQTLTPCMMSWAINGQKPSHSWTTSIRRWPRFSPVDQERALGPANSVNVPRHFAESFARKPKTRQG